MREVVSVADLVVMATHGLAPAFSSSWLLYTGVWTGKCTGAVSSGVAVTGFVVPGADRIFLRRRVAHREHGQEISPGDLFGVSALMADWGSPAPPGVVVG